MMLMPGNNASGYIHYWAGRVPGLIGHLWSPGRRITCYPWIPYVLDNRRYADLSKGRIWNKTSFINHIEHSLTLKQKPLWVVVPDIWGNAQATLDEWYQWEPQLKNYGIPLAFAAQDPMEPKDVPPEAQIIFIGGSDNWRYPVLKEFVALGKPVHVGRVSARRIWTMHKLGVTSVDSNSWLMSKHGHDRVRLELYLRYRAGESHLEEQLDLFENNEIALKPLNSPNKGIYSIPHTGTFPDNIRYEHLIMAIENWQDVPEQQQPRRYAVQHQGNLYPVKLLIARANVYANGYQLPVSAFTGGRDAYRFLRCRGMQVVPIQ